MLFLGDEILYGMNCYQINQYIKPIHLVTNIVTLMKAYPTFQERNLYHYLQDTILFKTLKINSCL